MTETSLKAIGVILGGKDHSTIKHGIEKIENEMQVPMRHLSNTINIIEEKNQSGIAPACILTVNNYVDNLDMICG